MGGILSPSAAGDDGHGGYSDGRLHARPALLRQIAHQRQAPLAPGTHELSFADGRRALLHVPPDAERRHSPLLVLLHGATGLQGGGDQIALEYAARSGSLLLIPFARERTWDLLRGGYGADLAFLDRGMLWLMQRYEVDEQALAIAGFSDGASYALSVGLMNGTLFRDILAFSPGFMAPLRREGEPRIFISHGLHDKILGVQRGRDIAARLAAQGYPVRYEEFDGAHLVPPDIAHAALARCQR